MSSPERDADEITTTLSRRMDTTPIADVVFDLFVLDGPDARASFRIDASHASRVLVGTSPACAVRLSDREVSRRHLALDVEGTGLQLADLGSTNGTSINGVFVREALLVGGETLRIGTTTMRVESAQAAGRVVIPLEIGFGRFIGSSIEVRRLFPLCKRLASTSVPVILEGETGTGKEILAESLHEQGARAAGPFVVFDCTQVPPNLVESELFGHEKGAFTGAIATRKGVFEQAHGGTLLIDEIGDLELAMQSKLLRALERGEIRRVGGDKWIKLDVRVVAATRRDLDRQVQEGRFRDDLFHRLAVARVELPPLRRRRGDVAMLVQHFCRELGGDDSVVPNALLNRWEEYEWPGNVRELRNAVARRIALGDLAAAQSVAAEGNADGARPRSDGSDFLHHVLAMRLPLVTARERVIEEFERRYVEHTLADHEGSVARAAAASGVARRHFQRIKARSRG